MFLVDCGASSDFVATSFLSRYSLLDRLSPPGRPVRGYDGTSTPSLGTLQAKAILHSDRGELADHVPHRAFIAAPLSGEDAILGLPWLRSMAPLMDWPNGVITVQGHTLTLALPRTASNSLASRLCRLWTPLGASPELDGSLHAALQHTESGDAAAPGDPLYEPLRAAVYSRYADVFSPDLRYPPARHVDHAIDVLPGSTPPCRHGLRFSRADDIAINEYVADGLKRGFLRPSTSAYAAMPFQVPKKDTDERRTVVDYRGLNAITVKDKYPLPRMDALFDQMKGAKFFSKLDLRTGFHQIRIREADRHKTAFRTSQGLFEYNVLAMGLCNAPGTFMRMMNDAMREFLHKFVLVFLDDIIIYSDTLEEHQRHLELVMQKLRELKLYAKLSKCILFQSEVDFLGHRVGTRGLRVMEDKVRAIAAWPPPATVRDVRAFLGLTGFYRRFMRGYSDIALPLTRLTRTVTGSPFEWGPEQQSAFDELKRLAQTAPVLVLPDPTLPYVLHTDASGFAIGAVLQQDQGEGLQPVAYFSQKMLDAETRYPVHEQELLAIVEALTTWQHYLKGAVGVRVLTDHRSLVHFQTQPMLSGRQVRWLETLSQF